MKESTAQLGYVRRAGARSALRAVPPESQSESPSDALKSASQRRTGLRGYGIQVEEDELGSVTAQCVYRLRCECGRSWFELELPQLVQCPACLRLNLVTI